MRNFVGCFALVALAIVSAHAQNVGNLEPGGVLQAESRFGTTDVDLEAREPTNISTSISLDNSGYDFKGRNRLELTTTDRSLFGRRDAIAVREYWAKGL